MTNQNDTQDEAELVAFEKIYRHSQGAVFFKDSSEGKEWKRNIAEYFHAEGYRAGKEPQLNLNRMLLSTNGSLKETVAALQEELNQSKRETQAAVHLCEQSRAEVERLKADFNSAAEAAMIHGTNHDNLSDIYLVLRKQLAAEKQKALKLVEALKYYRGIVKGTWGYDGIIAAKYDNAISDYSTDSGDGVG